MLPPYGRPWGGLVQTPCSPRPGPRPGSQPGSSLSLVFADTELRGESARLRRSGPCSGEAARRRRPPGATSFLRMGLVYFSILFSVQGPTVGGSLPPGIHSGFIHPTQIMPPLSGRPSDVGSPLDGSFSYRRPIGAPMTLPFGRMLSLAPRSWLFPPLLARMVGPVGALPYFFHTAVS